MFAMVGVCLLTLPNFGPGDFTLAFVIFTDTGDELFEVILDEVFAAGVIGGTLAFGAEDLVASVDWEPELLLRLADICFVLTLTGVCFVEAEDGP